MPDHGTIKFYFKKYHMTQYISKKKAELVIFDLDGTLLNTIEDLGTACNYALNECGFPTRRMEEYNTLVGRGIDNLFRGALPEEGRTEETVKKMRSIFIPYYDAHKCDRTRPYNGIPEVMLALKEAGIKVAVASNKYQEGTELLVRHFFGYMDFIKILGQREGHPIKPSPEIVGEAIRAAGNIVKENVIYIGDSDVDMETGRNAGVKTIGVTWGFRSRKELEAYSPWHIAESPEELKGYIL